MENLLSFIELNQNLKQLLDNSDKLMLQKLKKLFQSPVKKSPLEFVKAPTVSETERYYDKWTQEYLKWYGNIFQAARPDSDEEFLDYYIQSMGIQDGMRLLDAGCGVGGPSIYFAEKKDVIIDALTISNVQVEMTKAHINESGVENKVDIRKGDFHKLDKIYPANSYDLVFFLESIGYADSFVPVLSGVYKVLKPGGCIYIKDYFFVPSMNSKQFEAQTNTANEVRDEYFYRVLDIENLFSLLRKMGFYLVFIKRREFTDDYTKAVNFEKANDHASVCMRAMVNPYPLYEPLELKFQKMV